MTACDLVRGGGPLLISVPHVGGELPPGMAARLTPGSERLPDTDWFVDRLYDFADELGATVLRARYSRYVVDLNRPPDDASLYPGQATTGLFPDRRFDGAPLFRDDAAPDATEWQRRIDRYWRPYHDNLAAELVRLRARHDRVLLWEAHSIRSFVPLLFDDRLPDLNLGTADSTSCRPGLGERLAAVAAASPYSSVLNGRFKGGYITRRYGDPANGIDAVQLEIGQSTYMDEEAMRFDEDRAAQLRPIVRALVEAALR